MDTSSTGNIEYKRIRNGINFLLAVPAWGYTLPRFNFGCWSPLPYICRYLYIVDIKHRSMSCIHGCGLLPDLYIILPLSNRTFNELRAFMSSRHRIQNWKDEWVVDVSEILFPWWGTRGCRRWMIQLELLPRAFWSRAVIETCHQ
jgi:hypothetical protein